MRRLYVAPMAVYLAHRLSFNTHMTTHWMGLVDTSDPEWEAKWEAKGKPVVISTELTSEGVQEAWETHPEVMVLPHPVFQGNNPILMAREQPENTILGGCGAPEPTRPAHGADFGTPSTPERLLDGVDHLVGAGFGVKETDTVLMVHKKLAAISPAFRMRPIR